jgi:hypothetical protein
MLKRRNGLLAAVILSMACGLASACTDTAGNDRLASPSATATPDKASTTPADTRTSGEPSAPRAAATGGAPTRSPACGEARKWGTGLKRSAGQTDAELYNVRAGRHACYERVVFDVNGAGAAGYQVQYVKTVLADASGEPVPIGGVAALEVIVRAPDFASATSGHQPGRKPWTVGQVLLRARGGNTLTEVKFAGSFEGQTTFAVGAQARVPFRVFTQKDRAVTHVVLDLANR